MKASVKLGIVLLAAGRSERFGSNKLLAEFDGRPLICRALEAAYTVPAEKRVIVTGSEEVAQLAGTYGFSVIENTAPQLGQSHSIRLGVHAMQGMDAVLLLVGDQPRLTSASLNRLSDTFRASEKGIACLQDETHMGNPAVLSVKYYPELLALTGDRGAKGILKAHQDDLIVVDCVCSGELCDADTPQMLEKMKME